MQIIIGPHFLTPEAIKSGQWPALEDYFDQSLRFCQEWLLGQKGFQLQTSGSTGKPKSISVSRHQMALSAAATGKFFGIKTGSKLLCCLNTELIAGKMMLVRAIEWDCDVYLSKPSGNPLLGFPENQQLDFVAMVPLQLENCLQDSHSLRVFQKIKHLIIGGAPLSPVLQKKASQWPVNLYQTYGMTETVSHIALAKIGSNSPLIYQALPGVHLDTTDDHRLVIHAPMATAPNLETNDIVGLIGQDQFIWKGRADFTINSGGLKLQPEELEDKMNPFIQKWLPGRRYFVIGEPHPSLGQQVVLVIETHKNKHMAPTVLLESLKGHLSKYEIPKKIYLIENFIETPSGKINRIKTLALCG